METQSEPLATKALIAPVVPTELRARMKNGERLQIIDVREFPEFANGHIASTQLMPLAEVAARCHELDRTLPVICVCRTGKRSAQAASTLLACGFRKVSHLDGGTVGWEQSGLPLVKDGGAPWSLERQVRLSLGLFVLTGLALSLRWPAAIIISWIMGVGMVVTSIIDWCGMALILARAPWNRQQDKSCNK